MLSFDRLNGHFGVLQGGFDFREILLDENLLLINEDHLLLQLLLNLLGCNFLFLRLKMDAIKIQKIFKIAPRR